MTDSHVDANLQLIIGKQVADADLIGRSTVAAEIAAQTHIYLADGMGRSCQLHDFLSDSVRTTALQVKPDPGAVSAASRSRPRRGR